MYPPSRNQFRSFLLCSWGNSRFYEFRTNGKLVCLAVVDHVDNGMSAVYTFYDPDLADRSLGTFAILQQIAWAQREGKRHLYLGYWIDGHRKMAYKRRYRPLESFDGHGWSRTTGDTES